MRWLVSGRMIGQVLSDGVKMLLRAWNDRWALLGNGGIKIAPVIKRWRLWSHRRSPGGLDFKPSVHFCNITTQAYLFVQIFTSVCCMFLVLVSLLFLVLEQEFTHSGTMQDSNWHLIQVLGCPTWTHMRAHALSIFA